MKALIQPLNHTIDLIYMNIPLTLLALAGSGRIRLFKMIRWKCHLKAKRDKGLAEHSDWEVDHILPSVSSNAWQFTAAPRASSAPLGCCGWREKLVLENPLLLERPTGEEHKTIFQDFSGAKYSWNAAFVSAPSLLSGPFLYDQEQRWGVCPHPCAAPALRQRHDGNKWACFQLLSPDSKPLSLLLICATYSTAPEIPAWVSQLNLGIQHCRGPVGITIILSLALTKQGGREQKFQHWLILKLL